MAKSTKYAATICIVLTILAAIGVLAGLYSHNPLIVVFFLLPAVVYEVYRTEGVSTKWASWLLLAILVLEVILLVFNVSFDLAGFLEKTETTMAGYTVPLGDLRIVAPTVIAVLSAVLFANTRGVYTKWLSVIIIVGALATIWLLNPEIFKTLLKFGVEKGLEQLG